MNPLLENARAIAEGETHYIDRPCLIAMTAAYGKEWIGKFEYGAELCGDEWFQWDGVCHVSALNLARHERVMALCFANEILGRNRR